MKRMYPAFLLILCFFILPGCQADGGKDTARLGECVSPDARAVSLILRREDCVVWTGTDANEEGEERGIAFPGDRDLADIGKMTALEELVLEFDSEEQDQDLMRKLTEAFLALPSLRWVVILSAPYDLGALQAAFPAETHLVNCSFETPAGLQNVQSLFLTDTVWDQGTFEGTEAVAALYLDGSSVPEKLEELSAFPGLSRLTLPADAGSYSGEWPIGLSFENAEIPDGVQCRFSTEDFKVFLEERRNVAVLLRPVS